MHWKNADTYRQTDNGSMFGGFENPRNDRDERENVDRKMGGGG